MSGYLSETTFVHGDEISIAETYDWDWNHSVQTGRFDASGAQLWTLAFPWLNMLMIMQLKKSAEHNSVTKPCLGPIVMVYSPKGIF